MKTFIGIIFCSSILFISAAVDQDMQGRFLPVLDVENPSMSSNLSTDSSPTHKFEKSPLTSEREILGEFNQEYINSTHEVSASIVVRNTWKYFKNGVVDYQKNEKIDEKFVLIDIDRTPSLLPQQPNKIWTLAGSKGASINVQLSAKIFVIEFGLHSFSTTIEIPDAKRTHVTGDCDGEIKNMKISWASSVPLKNNSIDMYFKKLNNVYNLHSLDVTVFSKYTMRITGSPDLMKDKISECKGVNETCSCAMNIQETHKMDEHKLVVHLAVDDIVFHITENTYEFGVDNLSTSFNLSSTSFPIAPTTEFKKSNITARVQVLSTFEKNYINSTHKASTLTVVKNEWCYEYGVVDHQQNENISETFVPIDIGRTPSLLPQKPNKTWTLAGSKGASIKVQLSAELFGVEFGLRSFSTRTELPNVNETHVTGDCDGEIKNIKISWKSFDPSKNNSINMYFEKLDNVYNLHRINMTVFSQNITNLASHDLINRNISDCNGINETCNYYITLETIKRIDNHRIGVKLMVYDMEFHITENIYESEYTLFGVCAVFGFVLVILIGLAIYKSIKSPDYKKFDNKSFELM